MKSDTVFRRCFPSSHSSGCGSYSGCCSYRNKQAGARGFDCNSVCNPSVSFKKNKGANNFHKLSPQQMKWCFILALAGMLGSAEALYFNVREGGAERCFLQEGAFLFAYEKCDRFTPSFLFAQFLGMSSQLVYISHWISLLFAVRALPHRLRVTLRVLL